MRAVKKDVGIGKRAKAKAATLIGNDSSFGSDSLSESEPEEIGSSSMTLSVGEQTELGLVESIECRLSVELDREEESGVWVPELGAGDLQAVSSIEGSQAEPEGGGDQVRSSGVKSLEESERQC